MKNHNAKNEPESKRPGFSCELFRFREPASKELSEFASLAAFENWIDKELLDLESRFSHCITVNSLRTDLKSGR